ncbi:MAG: endolytic transglycosylase MltG [Oscillospiraceae bacterium]|nr:endolytic transglycosylase MltG [Oscillospiraceae bacterium]
MDNEIRPDQPLEPDWLDELLSPPELGEELGVDEQAVTAAGLTDPAELELEQIIYDTKIDQLAEELAEPALSGIDAEPEEPICGDTNVIPVLPEEPEILTLLAEEAPAEESRELFQDEEFRMAFGENGEALEEIFEEAPAEETLTGEPEAILDLYPSAEETETEPEEEAPMKKRRPRKKNGYGLFGIPHLIATVIWLAIAVTVGVSLGRLIWVCASDVLAFGRQSEKVSFTVSASDDLDTIAENLRDAGLIKYPQLFKLYADITDAQEEIDPGTYELDTIYDYNALVNFMSTSSSSRDVVSVLIPEGYTCAQIFALLEEKGVCTAAELEEYAANGELGDYWFLEGVERGSKYCLEGFLFPDTYDFYVGDHPGRVLSKLLGDGVGGFDVRFTDIMQEKLDTLNQRLAAMMKKNGYDQTYIDQNLLTVRDVVIVASMIEKETSGSLESFTIASVIYNRLTNQKEYPYLNIDATIIYALGGKTDPLTDEDMKIDSPYNSYTHRGLIPGPISNPGISSLNAALDPEDTSYYYYVYDPSLRAHHFSETYKQHQNYIASMED